VSLLSTALDRLIASHRLRPIWNFVANFLDRRFLQPDRDALMAKRRFRIASSWDELGEHEATVRQVDAILQSGQIEKFEPLFRAVHGADQSLPSGCAVHEALIRRLFRTPSASPAEQEQYLAPFRAAFERAPSPFIAGLLGTALASCSDESRGADVADETSEEQWNAYFGRRAQARAVLDACPDVAGDCPIWRRADYDLALDEAQSRGAYDAAFERAWALDRHNLNLCASHGIMLLPRWVGEGPQDLEVFARRAVSLTEARFGAGAYAFIHSVQAGVGSHEASDTLCDPDLLVHGFEDLTARFPTSQSVLNRYAMTMHWIGDQAAVYRVQKRIDTITPNIWGWSCDDEEAEGLNEALDAFSSALDRFEQDE